MPQIHSGTLKLGGVPVYLKWHQVSMIVHFNQMWQMHLPVHALQIRNSVKIHVLIAFQIERRPSCKTLV